MCWADNYTENPEAYQLYLKGRYYIDSLTKEGFEKSFEYLNKAIALDPNYALAWDGPAYYHINTVDLIASPREAFTQARKAAACRMSIDEALAEAHTSLAMIDGKTIGTFRQPSASSGALSSSSRAPHSHINMAFFWR